MTYYKISLTLSSEFIDAFETDNCASNLSQEVACCFSPSPTMSLKFVSKSSDEYLTSLMHHRFPKQRIVNSIEFTTFNHLF